MHLSVWNGKMHMTKETARSDKTQRKDLRSNATQ